jgi:rhodanese-related sulfurtransferase
MLWVALFAAVAAPTAEPVGIARAARAVDAATVTATLADPVFEACRADPRAAGLVALPCRLALVATLLRAPPATPAELKARQALLADVVDAAAWASEHVPDRPTPGLRRARLDAHRRACEVLFDGAASFDAVTTPSLQAEARAAAAALRERACSCAQRTVTLAVGADAPPDEQAEVQAVLTGQRCFLGADAPVAVPPRGPDDLSRGSVTTRKAAAAASPAGRLLAFAATRTVELQRCTEKGIAGGRITDAPRLDRCACGVVTRWKLPLQKSDGRVEAELPLADGVVLPVVVDAGAVVSCGPARAP